MSRIAAVGGGKMASALLAGAMRAGLWPASEIAVAEKNAALHARWKKLGCHVCRGAAELPEAEAYLLCVKPHDIADACAELSGSRDLAGGCVISIAAGVRVVRLQSMLVGAKIVRAMPNTPAAVGEGCTFAYCPDAGSEDRELVARLFSSCGIFSWVGDETLIDTATALSGSGPAYAFLLIEAMTAAAVGMGMEHGQALNAATQTLRGAAAFLRESGSSPEQLRADVTSPGGTTEQALRVLSERGFAQSISEAMCAACKRARELSDLSCAAPPGQGEKAADAAFQTKKG